MVVIGGGIIELHQQNDKLVSGFSWFLSVSRFQETPKLQNQKTWYSNLD